MATFEQAKLAMEHHEEALFNNPNVTYTSVVARNEDGEEMDDYVVEVGLLEEEPEVDEELVSAESDFAASMSSDRVPAMLPIPPAAGAAMSTPSEDATDLPASDEAVAVVTDVSGAIGAESFTGRRRPAKGGNSIGNPRWSPVGTLGIAFVSNKKIYILSNWHVLYGGPGRNGDPVIQQGRGDGGKAPADIIARNVRGWLDEYRDAAIAQVTGPGLVAAGTRCYGAVAGLAKAGRGRNVKKCGRTTMATAGTVKSTAATVLVSGYPGGARRFRDQIQLSRMSAAGDSGSVVIDSETNKIVGLLFAGGATATFANKIERIFNVAGAALALADVELENPSFDI